MRFRLVPRPVRVMRRAWTSRLLIVAALLTAGEAVLPYVYGMDLIPSKAFPFVLFGIVVAAFVARIILQETLHDD